MTAVQTLERAVAAGPAFQRPINAFMDEFRRATDPEREALVAAAIAGCGPIEALLAAVVDALCRETGTPSPPWVSKIASPEPFFAFPARSYALRVRLMIESPPPFKTRNVFVPENYLSRA